jgi:cytolysin-activating lysine-acyltransferase
MTPKNPPTQLPDVATFSSVLGQAVWLMTVSAKHRDLKVSDIEALVTPAVVLQQFKLYYKGKQPIAFLSWAMVSDDVKARFEAGERRIDASQWRSGSNLVIVECVSPFAESSEIEKQFWSSATSGQQD